MFGEDDDNTNVTMLALMAAGVVKESDDFLGLIQGVSLNHSKAIADWMCLATGAPVHLKFIEIGRAVEIMQTPEELAKKMSKKKPASG